MAASRDSSQPSTSSPPDLGRLRIDRTGDGAAGMGGFPWIRVMIGVGLLGVLFLFRDPLLGMVASKGGQAVRTGRAVKGGARSGAPRARVSANGYIVADRAASLATVLSGRLVELNAAEGDIVAKDEVVARIQYDDYEAEARRAALHVEAVEARHLERRANAKPTLDQRAFEQGSNQPA